jgi:hypothetical protein
MAQLHWKHDRTIQSQRRQERTLRPALSCLCTALMLARRCCNTCARRVRVLARERRCLLGFQCSNALSINSFVLPHARQLPVDSSDFFCHALPASCGRQESAWESRQHDQYRYVSGTGGRWRYQTKDTVRCHVYPWRIYMSYGTLFKAGAALGVLQKHLQQLQVCSLFAVQQLCPPRLKDLHQLVRLLA